MKVGMHRVLDSFAAVRNRCISCINSAWIRTPGVPAFILTWACINALIYHVPLYHFAIDNLDMGSAGGWMGLASLFVVVFLFTAMLAGCVAIVSVSLLKGILMLLSVGNAVAVYFIGTYNVVLDKSMMGNAFNTNMAEATGLFHPWLLVYVLLLGILPCWWIARSRLRPATLLVRLRFPIVCLVVLAGWLYMASQSWLWIDKHAKQLGGMVMPWSYLVNGGRFVADQMAPVERKMLPDAHFLGNDKKVVVLMIGESARAQNFSLYGYDRPTNPSLSHEKLTVYPAQSCATYTTAAVECILSHEPPQGFSKSEVLTSYLQRHGVDVTWRTNNSGEPPMQVHAYERLGELKATCQGEECDYDGGLLNGLDARIAASGQQRLFIVIHLGGSHGPAYNTRYPQRFEQFKPVCASVQLDKCSGEELVNAYDNTIVYADHVIAQAIGMLKKLDGYSSSLIYLSDHGESLGEYNLYLHGTPWSLAPDFQKNIPFFVWDSARAAQGDKKPLLSTRTVSQANVFHTIMGAFGMRSAIYNPELDLMTGDKS